MVDDNAVHTATALSTTPTDRQGNGREGAQDDDDVVVAAMVVVLDESAHDRQFHRPKLPQDDEDDEDAQQSQIQNDYSALRGRLTKYDIALLLTVFHTGTNFNFAIALSGR